MQNQSRDNRYNSDCNHCDRYDAKLWFHNVIFYELLQIYSWFIVEVKRKTDFRFAVTNLDTNIMPFQTLFTANNRFSSILTLLCQFFLHFWFQARFVAAFLVVPIGGFKFDVHCFTSSAGSDHEARHVTVFMMRTFQIVHVVFIITQV